jgi:hypothetical protein
MNPRSILIVLATVGLSACVTPVWAEEVEPVAYPTPVEHVGQPCAEPAPATGYLCDNFVTRFVYSVARDTKRNNCWPEPFTVPARAAVRAPFVLMVAKGWERQNTLGSQHFDPETGKLNLAGQSRVTKILIEGLPEHRTIYVQRSLNPEETLARVDAVQQLAAKIVPQGELPEVLETNLPPLGWPARNVDDVDRKFRECLPPPQLPAAQRAGAKSS